MDRKLPEKAEIERLIRLSESARFCLESEAARIRERFDIPKRVRGSLKEHPSAWLFGSLFSGYLASALFAGRGRREAKPGRRGIAGLLLGLTLTAARPVAKLWLTNQAGRWLRQFSADPLDHNKFP